MKVAIAAAGDNLEADVDPRFGRCSRFLIVNTRDLSFKVMPNNAQSAGHGAGISAAQTIINEGVDAVIAGSFGPNAFRMFASAEIPMYTFHGKISLALQKLQNNELPSILNPTDGSHSGLGVGYGTGAGAGTGRGAGRGGGGGGGGRGMGRGGGQGRGSGAGRRYNY